MFYTLKFTSFQSSILRLKFKKKLDRCSVNFASVLKEFFSRSTLKCVRFSVGSAAEMLEVENMMKMGPNGDNFDTEYLQKLYEVLLRSIGKVGSNQNFFEEYIAAQKYMHSELQDQGMY